MKSKNHFTILASVLGLLAAGCSTPQKNAAAAKTETPAAAAQPAVAPHSLPANLEDAVASGDRTPANRERDQYRHPVETLNFFGIKGNMTVVEISPGGGWYLEILAPYLAENGHYFAAVPTSTKKPSVDANVSDSVKGWLASHQEISAKTKLVVFSPPQDIVPAGTADLVLTFRNVHNWMMNGMNDAAFVSFFKALKPGGALGVVEHRGNPNKKPDPKGQSGYVLERDVIRMAKKAGFKLEAKSEINANPKDTKDYPEGVWTLPPTYRLEEKDHDKYKAIGESDRMTLKFIKPLKK
jgi:predicted methyltransferase